MQAYTSIKRQDPQLQDLVLPPSNYSSCSPVGWHIGSLRKLLGGIMGITTMLSRMHPISLDMKEKRVTLSKRD